MLALVECPTCLALKPPHVVCFAGHATCAACAARLTSCPLCRGALLPAPVPNRALLELLQLAIPSVRKCAGAECDHLVLEEGVCTHRPRHTMCECGVLVDAGDAAHAAVCAMRQERCVHPGCPASVSHVLRPAHEWGCEHRPLRCAMCSQRVPRNALWFHLVNAHGDATRMVAVGLDVDFSTEVRWRDGHGATRNGDMLFMVDPTKMQFIRVLPRVRTDNPCVVDVRVRGWDALADEEGWDAPASLPTESIHAVYLRLFMAPGRCFSASCRVGDTVSFALSKGVVRSVGVRDLAPANPVRMAVSLLLE